MPASSTNSDSSSEYMSGSGCPTKPRASVMPFSATVQRSACWEEKQTLPAATSRPLPSWVRSLSLAVTTTVPAPAFESTSNTVRERISSGPVMTTARPVARSR